MQILTNISKSELAYLTNQPTAKALIEKNKDNAINIPEGDVQKATEFSEIRKKEQQVDSLQISNEFLSSSSKGVVITKTDDNYNIQFKKPAYAYRAIKHGYIDVDGQKLILSEDEKLKLRAAADKAFNQMQNETLKAAAEHNAHVLRQQAEAISGESNRINDVIQLFLQMINSKEKDSNQWISPLTQLQGHSIAIDFEKTNTGFSLKEISVTDTETF